MSTHYGGPKSQALPHFPCSAIVMTYQETNVEQH